MIPAAEPFAPGRPGAVKAAGLLSEPVGRAVDAILARSLAGEALSVEELARQFHLSTAYFSRRFKAETGQSPYAFARRVRLEESAFRLKVEPDRRITDIGCDCGYSPSNYSWVFRRQIGQSPATFRRCAGANALRHPFCHLDEAGLAGLLAQNGGIRMQKMPELFVLCRRQIGNYHALGGIWAGFMRACRPWRTAGSQFLVRSFDDPAITNPDACLYDVCMTVPPGCGAPGVRRIPGGWYLVLPYRGPVRNIYAAYQALFTLWLPGSGRRIDPQYSYDLYHRMGGPEDVALDICLPLKRA